MDTIKPDHYKHKDKDLIQEWYERYSLDEFRAIMKSHIEKYIRRYERKNGVEDLEKAGEYIRRLKMIENNVWVISEEEEVPKPGEIVDGWLVEEVEVNAEDGVVLRGEKRFNTKETDEAHRNLIKTREETIRNQYPTPENGTVHNTVSNNNDIPEGYPERLLEEHQKKMDEQSERLKKIEEQIDRPYIPPYVAEVIYDWKADGNNLFKAFLDIFDEYGRPDLEHVLEWFREDDENIIYFIKAFDGYEVEEDDE